jgi:RNA polymerase sigma-70 factor, ECF subfamily
LSVWEVRHEVLAFLTLLLYCKEAHNLVSYRMKHVEREQLENAYHAHADELFRYCFVRIHDREKAKECVQETFTKVWDAMYNKKTVISNIRAYLYRTAHNVVINMATRTKTAESLDQMFEDTEFEPRDEQTLSPEIQAEYKEALRLVKTLPEEYAEPIVMRYVNGMTTKEISEALGESESNVSVRIHRGIKKLQEDIQKNI